MSTRDRATRERVVGDVLALVHALASRAVLLPPSPKIERLQRAIFKAEDLARNPDTSHPSAPATVGPCRFLAIRG
jgi:hypothetical protein